MGVHKGPWKEPNLPADGEPPDNGDVNARVSALEARLDTILPTLATKADMAELRSEFHKGFADMVKWIVGTAFAGLAAFVTITTFVLNNAVPKAPPAPAAQPPIIINVPGAAAPAAAPPARQPR